MQLVVTGYYAGGGVQDLTRASQFLSTNEQIAKLSGSAVLPAANGQAEVLVAGQGRNSGGFTPNQYLTAYGLTQLHNQGLRGAGERVALIEVDGFRTSDLRTFAQCFSVGVPKLHAFGVGVNHPLAPGPEATLDLEVLTAAAPKLATTMINGKTTAVGGMVLEWCIFQRQKCRGLRPPPPSSPLCFACSNNM